MITLTRRCLYLILSGNLPGYLAIHVTPCTVWLCSVAPMYAATLARTPQTKLVATVVNNLNSRRKFKIEFLC